METAFWENLRKALNRDSNKNVKKITEAGVVWLKGYDAHQLDAAATMVHNKHPFQCHLFLVVGYAKSEGQFQLYYLPGCLLALNVFTTKPHKNQLIFL